MFNTNTYSESRRGLFSIYHACHGRLIPAAFFVIALLIQGMICALLTPIRASAADTAPVVVRYPVYHRHTGSSGSGGGCYSIARTGTRTYEVPCGGTLYYWGDDWGTSECTRCGASYYGDRSGESCPHSETKSESYTYYELGCGHGTSDILGYVTYTRDTSEWAKEVHVTVSIENTGMQLSDEPYIMNGSSSDNGEFTLTENGTYTFSIAADSNSDTPAAAYTMDVHNIDRYEPVITEYTLTPTDWVREGVTLTLASVLDLQPDGTHGCGLHESPYSYDNGLTWTDDNTFFYENNGNYEVYVRDALENTAVLSFTIDNIDNEPPRILVLDYDHTRNLDKVTLNIECDDIMSDGREGVGLDEYPISYDGGKTWTDSTSYTITHNTVIKLRVRDKLGNTAVSDEAITNIDDYAPTVSHYLYPGYWTNGNVEVSFEAKDVNPDGSEGIGLPDDCFSYDSGRTWTDEDSVTVNDNCYVQVAVRDRNGNINYYSLDVINIDRIPPSVTASYTLTQNGKAAILNATGTDGESGIDLDKFIWSGPENGNGTSIIVTSPGTYTVTGYDRAGNSASSTIEVSGIKRPYILPIKPDISPIPADDNTLQADIVSVDNTVFEAEADPDTIKTFEAPVSPARKSLWDRFLDFFNNLNTWQKVLFILALIALIAGIILLLILWYLSVGIYNNAGERSRIRSDEDRYFLLGRKLLHMDNANYTVNVNEHLWDRAVTTDFEIRFNPIFALVHKDEQVYISFPEDVVKVCRISHKVVVTVR